MSARSACFCACCLPATRNSNAAPVNALFRQGKHAGWLVGRGLAFYCAQMPHAAMQLGRDSSVLAGRVSTRGATANYAAIGNFHAGSGQSAKNRVGWAGRLQQSACMPGNADQDRTHTSIGLQLHGLSSISVDIDEIRRGTLSRFHPYTALHRTS